MAGVAAGGPAAGSRLETELGYGLPVGSRLIGTPRLDPALVAAGLRPHPDGEPGGGAVDRGQEPA